MTAIKKQKPAVVRIPYASLKPKTIIAPADFSDISLPAISNAFTLAQSFSAELVLLHVLETFPIDYMLGLKEAKKMNTALEQEAQERITDLAESIPYPRIRTLIRWGKPFREIVNVARELYPSMIVISTHGHTGLKHVYLGSTAERVVRHATCSVVVVRS